MTSLLFALIAAALVCVLRGARPAAMALFVLGFALSAFWLKHHMTDPLALQF